ncbi:hypothetical protein MPSEU_001028500 [Mayamaea pseudoterrestris]|nr:hypothetical protein MPSEU_001028500 [Mayamaea pseudoterrestris]
MILKISFVFAALASCSNAFLQSPGSPLRVRNARHSLAVTSTLQPPARTFDNDDKTTAKEDSEMHADNEKFDWFKAWYPIIPVAILDHEKPHKFHLLGTPIIVWNDAPMVGVEKFGPKPKKGKRDVNAGQWRAFVDECPHRKVPLSEGRVEADGSLLCSYHAWRFDGEGDLVNVPQMDETELAIVKANPKSQCNSFPVKIVDGVLWVWPETGSDAKIQSALTEVNHYKVPGERKKEDVWYGPWNYRELPYSADFFIENVVDPVHVQVSHHNIIGSRYSDQQLDSMKLVNKVTKDGFKFQAKLSIASTGSNTTYHAPAHVAIETGTSGALQTLELYATPARPGYCHHVGRMVIAKDKNSEMPKLLRQFTWPMPLWVNHMAASLFLNQDALFLHSQERHLATTKDYTAVKDGADFKADNYNKAVLRTEADLGVVSFREWLRVLAGGRVPYKYGSVMPEWNRDIVFDVWNAHTKHCAVCQRALKNIKRARFTSFVAAACLAVLRPAASKALNLAGVVATAGLGLALSKLVGIFYKYEFEHAHND